MKAEERPKVYRTEPEFQISIIVTHWRRLSRQTSAWVNTPPGFAVSHSLYHALPISMNQE